MITDVSGVEGQASVIVASLGRRQRDLTILDYLVETAHLAQHTHTLSRTRLLNHLQDTRACATQDINNPFQWLTAAVSSTR